jgi:hypothetical protein
MCGPAVATPSPPAKKKPTSGGLQHCWGLSDPPSLDESGASEHIKQFTEKFKGIMAAVNQCLQYTKCNAVKEKHESMVADRDFRYNSFQTVRADVASKSEADAKGPIATNLGEAQALAGKANTLKQETEKSLKAWQAKELAYIAADDQIVELEGFDFKGVGDLRSLDNEIQKAVDENKYDDAVAKFGQLDTNLKPAYAEYKKQKEAKEYREKKWNELKPRIDALVADKPPIGNACEELESAKKVMDQSVTQKDWLAAKTHVDELSTRLEQHEKVYKQRAVDKKFYDEKWTNAPLKQQVEKVSGELLVEGSHSDKTKATLAELGKAKTDMLNFATAGQYDKARPLVEKLPALLAAYQQAKTLDKKMFDEKWGALKPQIDKVSSEILVEGTYSEKTKAAMSELGKTKTDMLAFAAANQHDKALPLLEKLPALLAAYEKCRKDDKANVRWFKPKFSVAETTISLDLNVEKDILVQFENAPDLSPEAKFKFALAEEGPAGTIMPIKVVSVETKQSTGVFKIKSIGVAAQTFKFKVTAEQGSDKAEWPVPQTSAVTVKKPEMVVTADTAKKYRPKDTMAVRIAFKNVNKPKEVLEKGLTCTLEANSVRDLDRGMSDIGTPASFKDPFNKEKEGWEDDNTYVINLKADHAGSTKVITTAAGLAFGAGNAGEAVKNESTFVCVSTLDEFKKKLAQTNAAQAKITGRITSFFAAIDLKVKEAKSHFDEAYNKDTAPERKGLGDGVIDFLWDKAKDSLGTFGKVIGIVQKIAVADAPTLVAANLNAMSKEQLGATLTIKAASSLSGVKPTYSNLGSLGTFLVGKLGETLGDAIKTWQNWAETATPDKDITFDPDDGLFQGCTIGGVRLVDLPLDSLNPDDYEREMWKQWVTANPEYFKVHGADLARGREGINTAIIARLISLRVDYPKNSSRF